jgi:tetratricopeptide (TPR) repeat protein
MVPQEADYWYMLVNAYVRMQEPDRAVQAYQQAIARNPDHTRAWHNLGIVRMRQAMAAFVSSASTAKAGDPMRELSTQLADELAHIGLGGENSGQTQAQLTTASPRPVYVVRPAARSAAGLVRRKPGGSASKDQP